MYYKKIYKSGVIDTIALIKGMDRKKVLWRVLHARKIGKMQPGLDGTEYITALLHYFDITN